MQSIQENEIQAKITLIRKVLNTYGLAGLRLRGVDWFAWATGGASNVVILTTETGVGEVFITPHEAWVLTDVIEGPRFTDEEISPLFKVWARPWNDPRQTEDFVRDYTYGGQVISDRPLLGERPLPKELVDAKRALMPEELERYRKLGFEAATAMSEALHAAKPEWTEFDLAAAGAQALWKKGIHPTLTLVAGEERLPKYRHPTPSPAKLGQRAMLVFCARRHGLYANLTRLVSFKRLTREDHKRYDALIRIEEAALSASKPQRQLNDVFQDIVSAYSRFDHPDEYRHHHQGGTTGYLSREVVANPHTHTIIGDQTALAWNPSIRGFKIEDTVVSNAKGIEILTHDPRWPVLDVGGRKRPAILER